MSDKEVGGQDSNIQSEKEIGSDITGKITSSKLFRQQPLTAAGKPFFTFVKEFDYLKGELVGLSGNRDIFRSQSYAMKVTEGRQAGVELTISPGQIEEFFGNAQLHRIIGKNQLMHSVIRVLYIGRARLHPKALHPAKVYRVFKDFGFIEPDERPRSALMPRHRKFKGVGEGTPKHLKTGKSKGVK